MRIISFNANGIRSAARKGFFQWLPGADADIVCIQEVRAQEEQLSDEIYWPAGYQCFYYDPVRKGYSGVALYSRRVPDAVHRGIGEPGIDAEARYLEARFGRLSVISLYLPSGSSGPQRQAAKFAFMDRFMDHLKGLRRKRRDFVICGDWNIAHKAIDLKNWRGNQKNSGFLPEERAWMDEVFGPVGFVDAFRVVNQDPEQYTWWSNRGQAWARNVGWRIDYQVTTPALGKKTAAVEIYKDQRFSDHAPLIMDYDYPA